MNWIDFKAILRWLMIMLLATLVTTACMDEDEENAADTSKGRDTKATLTIPQGVAP